MAELHVKVWLVKGATLVDSITSLRSISFIYALIMLL